MITESGDHALGRSCQRFVNEVRARIQPDEGDRRWTVGTGSSLQRDPGVVPRSWRVAPDPVAVRNLGALVCGWPSPSAIPDGTTPLTPPVGCASSVHDPSCGFALYRGSSATTWTVDGRPDLLVQSGCFAWTVFKDNAEAVAGVAATAGVALGGAEAAGTSNNILRIGPAYEGGPSRVSLGAQQKHWKELPGWRQQLQPFRVHMERQRGGVTYNLTGRSWRLWGGWQ